LNDPVMMKIEIATIEARPGQDKNEAISGIEPQVRSDFFMVLQNIFNLSSLEEILKRIMW